MTKSKEIEEILYEAHYLGITDKVMKKAQDWVKRKKMPKGVAYRRALERYKKEGKVEIGSSGAANFTNHHSDK